MGFNHKRHSLFLKIPFLKIVKFLNNKRVIESYQMKLLVLKDYYHEFIQILYYLKQIGTISLFNFYFPIEIIIYIVNMYINIFYIQHVKIYSECNYIAILVKNKLYYHGNGLAYKSFGHKKYSKKFKKIDHDIEYFTPGNGITTFIITKEGLFGCRDLYMDYNEDDFYSDTSKKNITKFKKIKIAYNNIKSIECGYDFTYILTNDGDLYSSGFNENGCLLIHNKLRGYSFKYFKKTDIKTVIAISCGIDHALVLTSQGLLAVGSIEKGQLGNRFIKDENDPYTYIETYEMTVIDFKCGNRYSYILLSNGGLYSTGHNKYGQLGLGHLNPVHTLTRIELQNIISFQCSDMVSMVLTKDGLYGCGNCYASPIRPEYNTIPIPTFMKINIKNIISYSCSFNYSVFKTEDDIICFPDTLTRSGSKKYNIKKLFNVVS